MKNVLKNTLCLLFLASSLASVVGCSGNSKDSASIGDHTNNNTETTDYLLRNSSSDYRIVVPSELSGDIIYARDELRNFFKEATGYELPVISDNDLTYSDSVHYISLGDTNVYNSSSLDLNKDALKRDGYYIRTKGKSIFIVGKTDIGVLYGAYHFLSEEFNFETYTPNTYEIDHNVKNVHLRKYDVFENPDIDMRTRKGYFNPVNYSDNNNVMFAYRMREIDHTEKVLLPIHEGDPASSGHNEVHNSYYFLPKGKENDPTSNVNLHPLFYSSTGQLCFTAGGDANEFKAMYEQAGDHVIASCKRYVNNKDYSVVQFGIVDSTPMCKCAHCEEVANKYNGSKAATIIIFLYEMGRYVTDWMNKPENAQYKRDLRYMFLAYMDSLQPPFVKNSDGSISVPKALKPYDDVVVMPYCAFDSFDESKSFYDHDNDPQREYIEIWGSVYPGAFAWSYGTFFNDYFCFYDAYSFYADYYKYLAKYKFSLTYEQLHSNQRGADTGFHECIGYCQAKLNWNSNLRMDELIENYFHAVYGVAYDTMKDIFQTWRLWFKTTILNKNGNNGVTVTNDTGVWNDSMIGFIRQMLSKFDKAYNDISAYKNDETSYTRLKYNVDLEWLFPAKVILDCYKNQFEASEYNAILLKFKTLIEQMQIKEHKEFTDISSYLSGLSEK